MRAAGMEGPVIQIVNGSRARVSRHWQCTLINDAVLTVRRGFSFDGASIPRLFWRVAGHPFQMPLLVAATAHDAMYSAELFSRGECDRIFRELMRRAGINRVKRNAVYYAVRCGGWAVWRRHTPESVARARDFCTIEVVA